MTDYYYEIVENQVFFYRREYLGSANGSDPLEFVMKYPYHHRRGEFDKAVNAFLDNKYALGHKSDGPHKLLKLITEKESELSLTIQK